MDISQTPLDPNSATYVAGLKAAAPVIGVDDPGGEIYNVVPASQPMVPVQTSSWYGFDTSGAFFFAPDAGAATAPIPSGMQFDNQGTPVRVERLLAHPDPGVVRRLLHAPSLQLLEALVIASRRPMTDAIVDEIVQSPRWIARIEVREALVVNPFVRPRVALALLATLLSPARRALARGSLHPIERRAAVAGDDVS